MSTESSNEACSRLHALQLRNLQRTHHLHDNMSVCNEYVKAASIHIEHAVAQGQSDVGDAAWRLRD